MTKISNQYSLTNILTADLANSRLGINNVSPTVALDVTGAGKFSSTVLVNSTLSAYLGTISSGNTPATSGTTPVNAMLNLTNNRGIGMYFGGKYSGDYAQWIQVSDTGNLSVNYPLLLNPNGGNVGIGTSSPGCNLDIFGAVTSTYFNLRITDSASMAANVGGGIALAGKYTSAGDTTDWGFIKGMKENGTSGDYGGYINFYTRPNGGSFAERMRITSGGNVGIGTSSPTQTLQVNGNIASIGGTAALYTAARDSTSNYAFYASNSTNILLFNSGPGNIGSFANNTGVYTPLSDINKKKDFELSTIGLNAILGLKSTLYRMESESDLISKHLGLIAQEVKEFIPQAYSETGDGEYKFIGLDYQAITSVLVKAIQELSAENTSLINRIEALENK